MRGFVKRWTCFSCSSFLSFLIFCSSLNSLAVSSSSLRGRDGGRQGGRESKPFNYFQCLLHLHCKFLQPTCHLPPRLHPNYVERKSQHLKNGGTKRGRQKEKGEGRGDDYRPHHPLDHRHQHWLQRKREFVGDTHTHTHTHILGGGSRRGLLELLVVGTVGASGEGEIYSKHQGQREGGGGGGRGGGND